MASWAAGDAAGGEDALAAPEAVDCVQGGDAAQRLLRGAPFCCTSATALTAMSASAAFRLELLAPAAGSAGRWRVSIRKRIAPALVENVQRIADLLTAADAGRAAVAPAELDFLARRGRRKTENQLRREANVRGILPLRHLGLAATS